MISASDLVNVAHRLVIISASDLVNVVHRLEIISASDIVNVVQRSVISMHLILLIWHRG